MVKKNKGRFLKSFLECCAVPLGLFLFFSSGQLYNTGIFYKENLKVMCAPVHLTKGCNSDWRKHLLKFPEIFTDYIKYVKFKVIINNRREPLPCKKKEQFRGKLLKIETKSWKRETEKRTRTEHDDKKSLTKFSSPRCWPNNVVIPVLILPT